MNRSVRYFAVVPAAGVGARVGAACPKQYLPLAGRTVLQHALAALCAAEWIEQVVVVVAPGDHRARALLGDAPRVRISPTGGRARRDSVLAGLDALLGEAGDDDWVLVHDAARPGLTSAALLRLRDTLQDHPVGGLLALPVADTVKRARADAGVECTVSREHLWLAQTPQMFRAGLLREALLRCPDATDEAGAVESMGQVPRLVEGERRNFKVTAAEDLLLMQAVLSGDAGAPGEATDGSRR